MCHKFSPNYHAYIELGTSAPSVAAEQLTAGMNYVTSYWVRALISENY